MPFDRAQYRETRTLSGGEQKRLALEALLRGPDDVLLLDEPDNYLDVPGKEWLEHRLRESPKTVLFVSHDREFLRGLSSRVLELGGDAQLVIDGEMNALPLRAVAEGGVKDQNPTGIARHGSSHHCPPLRRNKYELAPF